MIRSTTTKAAKRGFTLLELIVVLLILGILAAIAIPTYNTIQTNSVDRALTTTAEAIVRDANAIAASNGSGGVVTEPVMAAAAVEAFKLTPVDPDAPAASDVTGTVGNYDLTQAGTTLTIKQNSGNICRVIVVDITANDVAEVANNTAGDKAPEVCP